MRVLIADDEPVSRAALAGVLRNLGYDVIDVADGVAEPPCHGRFVGGGELGRRSLHPLGPRQRKLLLSDGGDAPPQRGRVAGGRAIAWQGRSTNGS